MTKIRPLCSRRKRTRVSQCNTLLLEPLESRVLPSVSLMTDKADYAPGETALISGNGFTAGETVDLRVVRTDGRPDYPGGNLPWQVTDGGAGDLDGTVNGSLQTNWFVEDQYAGAPLLIKATGESSGATGQWAFTDAATSVTITSPTTTSPARITVLPGSVRIAFDYSTSSEDGTSNGVANVTNAAGTIIATSNKSLTNTASGQTLSSYLDVTVPAGTPLASYSVTVTINHFNPSSNRTDSKSYTQTNSLVVAATSPPNLQFIPAQTVDEMTQLTFQATATDPDMPYDTLTFSLIGAPTGAAINNTTGVFTWTPAENQDGGSDFTVVVTDAQGHTDSQTLHVTINEVNRAPTLTLGAPTPNPVVKTTTVTFTASATDPDTINPGAKTNTLSFSLRGAPAGAAINSSTGAFTWTPGMDQDGAYTFTVRVTDDGNPNLYDEKTLTITTVAAGIVNGNLLVVGHNLVVDTISTLSNGSTTVTVNGASAGTFSGFEHIVVLAGNGGNTVTVMGGVRAEIYGGADSDTLTGGSGDDQISAGGGANVISGGAGQNVILGGAGTDVLAEWGDFNFTLTNGVLTYGANSDTFSGIDKVILTGGAGGNSFDLSGYSGAAEIHGGAGADSIVAAKNSDLTLTSTLLTATDGLSASLDQIENVNLTAGGNHVATVNGWTGNGLALAAGSLVLAGNVTTTGDQIYNGPVTLGTDETVSASAGNITFASTIDSASDGAYSLTTSSAGTTTFAGAVGAKQDAQSHFIGRLNNLTTEALGKTTFNGGEIHTAAVASLHGTGNLHFKNEVTLGVSPTFDSAGSTTFDAGLKSGDPHFKLQLSLGENSTSANYATSEVPVDLTISATPKAELSIQGGLAANTFTKAANVGGKINIKTGPSTNTFMFAIAASKTASAGSPGTLTIVTSGNSTTVASALSVDASRGTSIFNFSGTQASLLPTDPLNSEGHFDLAAATQGITLDLSIVDKPQVVSYTVLTDANTGVQQIVPNTLTLIQGSTVGQLLDSPFNDTITTAAPADFAGDSFALPANGTTVVLSGGDDKVYAALGSTIQKFSIPGVSTPTNNEINQLHDSGALTSSKNYLQNSANLASSSFRTALSSPAFRTALADPNFRTALADPDFRTALGSPDFRTALADPNFRTALADSEFRTALQSDAFRTALADPNFRTALENTDFRTALADSSFRTALANSEFRTALQSDAFRTALADPNFRTALADPNFRTALANNSFRTALANDAFRTALADTNFRTALADSNFRTALADPSFRTALADDGFRTALQSNAFRTALADPSFRTALDNPDFRTALADANFRTALQSSDFRTALADDAFRTALADAAFRTALQDANFRTALASADFRTALEDAAFRTALSSDAFRTALTIDAFRTALASSDFRTALESSAFRTALEQGQSDAFRTALEDANFRTALENSSFRTALADPNFRTALESDAFRTALASASFRTALANPDFRTALQYANFRTALENADFRTALENADFRTALKNDAFRTALANDAFRTALANDAFRTALQSDAFRTALANADFRTALASPEFRTALSNDSFRTALQNDAFRTALENPDFRTALQSDAFRTALQSDAFRTALSDPNLVANLANTAYRTALEANFAADFRTALENADFRTALADSAFRTALLSDLFRTALASPDLQTALADPAFRTALENPAFRTALADDAFRTALLNPEFATALANPDFAAALANPAFATLLANDAFRTALANPDFAALLANPAFTALLGNRAFTSLLQCGAFQNNAFVQGLVNGGDLLHLLDAYILDVFRLKVSMPDGNNVARVGLWATLAMGNGNNLLVQSLRSDDLAALADAFSKGIDLSNYALQVTTGAGQDVIVAGLLSDVHSGGGNDQFIVEDPSLLGVSLAGQTAAFQNALLGLGGSIDGGAGGNRYYFVGGAAANFGHVGVSDFGGAATLDFSGFQGGGITFNLASSADQQLVAGSDKLWIKLNAANVIKNLVGSAGNDVITGNALDNVITGAALADPRSVPSGVTRAAPTQWVFLDFGNYLVNADGTHSTTTRVAHEYNAEGVFLSETELGTTAAKYTYTAADQAAILAGLRAIYAPFGDLVKFTLNPGDLPANGNYAIIPFNQTPVDEQGKLFAGGRANEIDFRNVNQKIVVAVDINGFLGSLPGQVPDDRSGARTNFINLSVFAAAHELEHTMGGRHWDAFGPPAFGVAPLPPSSDLFAPPYPGPTGAFESYGHIIASPAAIGLSLADAANGLGHLGEREAIVLSMIAHGVVRYTPNVTTADVAAYVPADGRQVSSAATNVTLTDGTTGGTVANPNVMALGELPALDVPNPIQAGFNAGKKLDVAAIDVLGQIDPGQADYYSFQGVAGDVITIDAMSGALSRFDAAHSADGLPHYFDPLVRIYGPNGALVATNDDQFEPTDALLLDLSLPQSGAYYVVITQRIDPNKKIDDAPESGIARPQGKYELFLYRFASHNPTSGNDTFVASGGNDVMDGGDGVNTLQGANLANAWTVTGSNAGNLQSAGLTTFTNIQSLVGGAQADGFSFQSGGVITGTINGSAGTDTLTLAGTVTLTGSDSTGYAGMGASLASFGGINALVGSGAADTLAGENQNSTWNLGSTQTYDDGGGNGTLAFSGFETLQGGSGADTFNLQSAQLEGIRGGAGNDKFVLSGAGSLTGAIDGQGGADTLDCSARTDAVTVNLLLNQVSFAAAGVFGIENVTGSQGNNILVGDDNANILKGGTARSIIIGGKGADVITGSANDDIFVSGTTSWDINPAALSVLLKEWIRTDLVYKDRVSNIMAGSSTGLNVLPNGVRVLLYKGSSGTGTALEDVSTDKITGGAGTDLFFFGFSLDVVTDAVNSEKLVNLDNSAGTNKALVEASATTADSGAPAIAASAGIAGGPQFVSVQSDDGSALPADLQTRIDDALAYWNDTFGFLGTTLVEVPAGTEAADIRIHFGPTSPVGGLADGVLGCTTDDGAITLIQGWNWYTGASANQIGSNQFDFETITMHEVGHALGLGHSSNASSVMFASLAAGQVKRALTAQDLTVLDDAAGGAHGLHALPSPAASATLVPFQPVGNLVGIAPGLVFERALVASSQIAYAAMFQGSAGSDIIFGGSRIDTLLRGAERGMLADALGGYDWADSPSDSLWHARTFEQQRSVLDSVFAEWSSAMHDGGSDDSAAGSEQGDSQDDGATIADLFRDSPATEIGSDVDHGG